MGTLGIIRRNIYRRSKSEEETAGAYIRKHYLSPRRIRRKLRGGDRNKKKDAPYDKQWNENAAKYSPYRDAYDGLVVGITGSVGKTTTKQYIGMVLGTDRKTFISPSNFNRGMHLVRNMETRMNPDYKAFVQECGADVPGTVLNMASLLRPDIAIVTNVKPHHLAEYGTIENVFDDKIQMVEKLAKGGTAIVNMDDEMLAAYDYKCRTVTMGIECEADVDYRAVDINQEGDELVFDILHGADVYHIKSTVIGKENAYNIMAAFITGRLAGVSEENILQGIRSYKARGSRQNVVRYGGYTLYMDCYNVTNDTIVAAFNNLKTLDVGEGGRRIAVIGGENRLGERRVEATAELGQRIAADADGIDEIICYGHPSDEEDKLNWFGDAPLLYRTIRDAGVDKVRLIRDFDDMVRYLGEEVHAGDAVLFKCIVYLNMPIVVDKALGTFFSINQRIVTKYSKPQTWGRYTGLIVPDMKEVYIKDVSRKLLRGPKVVVPDEIGGLPVFGIERGLYAYSDFREADLGNTLKLIGTGAFRGCAKLEEVVIPDSVMHIMEGAFRDCKSLRKVTIGRGIKQIDANAFAGCGALEEVIFTGDCEPQVDETAFPADFTKITKSAKTFA